MPDKPPKCSACGGGDRVQVVSDHRRYANSEQYAVQVWLCEDKRGVVKKQRETLFDPRAL
jgi:hypothetical protein